MTKAEKHGSEVVISEYFKPGFNKMSFAVWLPKRFYAYAQPFNDEMKNETQTAEMRFSLTCFSFCELKQIESTGHFTNHIKLSQVN